MQRALNSECKSRANIVQRRVRYTKTRRIIEGEQWPQLQFHDFKGIRAVHFSKAGRNIENDHAGSACAWRRRLRFLRLLFWGYFGGALKFCAAGRRMRNWLPPEQQQGVNLFAYCGLLHNCSVF